jgi:predicted nucleic acid-binding protein
VSWLLDTNVVSELRKRDRADPGVIAWRHRTRGEDKYLSVLTLGEVRRGIDSIRRRDEPSALALEQWLSRLRESFSGRILKIDEAIADRWGALDVPDRLPVVDGLLAATALVHGLTLVTRNVRDIERTGVPLLDPFSPGAAR